MIPPALNWFAKPLCQNYAYAPQVARDFGKRLEKQLHSKRPRIQVNREFARSHREVAAILSWMQSKSLSEATNKRDFFTRKTRLDAIRALRKINRGVAPSTAWGMDAKRGPKVGFSASLEASALVHYLTSLPEENLLPENIFSRGETVTDAHILLLLYVFDHRPTRSRPAYTDQRAREIAGELFGLHPESIRKFEALEAISDLSAAVVVAFALTQRQKLVQAGKYLDVERLFDVVARAGYLPVTN